MSYEDALKTRLHEQECHFTWSLRKEDFAVSDLLNRLNEQIQLESGEARVTRAYSSLGFSHYLHGNLQEALKNLQKSVQLAKEYYKETSDEVLIVTYGDLAWLHYYMKEFSTCEDYLRLLERIHKTFSEEPVDTVPLEVLREKGWAFLKFSWKYYNGAKECFRQALEKNPDDSDLNRGYSIAMYRKAGTSESLDSPTIHQLRKAIRLNPDDFVLPVLLALRMMYIKDDKKTYYSAVQMMICALLKSPKNPYVIRYAAQFISQMGSVDDAIRLLEKALQDTPDSAFLHHQLAECYTKKNETLEKTNAECNEMYLCKCVYHLEQAIALKPTFIHAVAELALQYGRQGLISEAERMFENAFKLANNKKDHLPVVYCLYGQYQLWYQRSEEKAIYNFIQGLRLQPKSSEGIRCEENLRMIAEDRIQRLQNPYDGTACEILGFIEEVKGEKLQAAELYERALTHGLADGENLLLIEMRIWLMSFQEASKSVLKLIFDEGRYDEGLFGGGGLKTVQGTMAKNIVNLVEIDISNVKRILRSEQSAVCPGPHAVILAFPLDRGEFTEKTKEILEDLEFLGEKFWNHVMVVFIEGDSSMNEYHGTQGRVLEWLLEKCGGRYYISGKASHTAEMGELSKRIQEMIQSNNSMHLLLPEVSDGDTQSLCDVLKGTDIKDDDLVTPKIVLQDGQTVYRLSCSVAGWFHCKFTKLGFYMKHEGEVLYSTVLHENSCPIPTNCYPAGPLYDIRCVQGELSQLKLPHCETSIDDGIHSMSVIHFSGDIVEVLKPQNITSTHVTVSITGTSKFRISKAINWFKEKIFGQVMLFYLQPTHKLHVFLQPNNVVPRKVADCDPKYVFIQTICECTLKYNRTYSMSCDPVEEHEPSLRSEIKIQPQHKQFCCTSKERDHYFPTFEIFMPNDVMNVRLSLKKENPDPEKVKVVWRCEIHLRDLVTNKSVSSSTDEQCVAFLKINRCALIQSVVNVDAILDGLVDVIHREQLNKIRAKTIPQEKTRAICDILKVKPAFTQRFFTLLKQNEPNLVAELMLNKSTGSFS